MSGTAPPGVSGAPLNLAGENRNALIVDAELTFADGYAERATALEMLARLPKMKRRRTVAGDKGYDTRGFVADARALGFTPHVAQNNTRQRSALAVAVYGGLAVVVHRMTTDRVAERTAVVLATVIALLVGVGRLVQTMHYPSDIVLGWAEGAACLAVGVVASRHIRAEDRPVEEVPVATGAAP